MRDGKIKITSLCWKHKHLKDVITLLTTFIEHLWAFRDAIRKRMSAARDFAGPTLTWRTCIWGSKPLWTTVATYYQVGNCGPWLMKNCDITVVVLDIRLVFSEELGLSRRHDLTWMLRRIAFHLSFASSSSSTFSAFCRFLRPKSQQIV
jgi:hypothetical protein